MTKKQRILSILSAAAMTFSLLSTTGFAQNLKYDANGDGNVNARDALYILRESANSSQDLRFDANGDGYVNAKDALFVLKYSAGLIKDETPDEPDSESILDNYEVKWAYSTLTDKQKKAYSAILEGALKNSPTINLYDLNITASDLKKAFWACDYDNPKLLNIDNGYEYTYSGSRIYNLKVIYCKNAQQTAAALKNVANKTADVIAQAKNLPSDYERVKLFHDWIINRTEYIASGYISISETDGPILYGKALCEGYSRAFEYLCQSVGIECVCISGTARSSAGTGKHMWNMVKLDGKWYHIDVTWDDPITMSGKQILEYNYFLLSDLQIKKDHTVNTYFKVPTATSVYKS